MRRFRLEIIGALALAVVVTMAASLIAFLHHAFSDELTVTATIPVTGAPLPVNADVKVRGVVIGRVADARVEGDRGVLTVKLVPSKAKLLPANVTSRALPSTLFGHEFLELVLPADPKGELQAGASIPEDSDANSVETQRLLADTYPLLSSLHPMELDAALTAVATALDGHGEQVGTTIDDLDAYLTQLAPHYPALVHDLRALTSVVATGDRVAPDLLGTVDDLAVTTKTLVDVNGQLRATLASGAAAATALGQLLTDNENRLITLTASTRTTLTAADANLPGLAGTVKSLPTFLSALERVSGGNPYFRIELQLDGTSRGVYTAADCPRYPGAAGSNCPGAQAGTVGPVGSAAEQLTVREVAGPLLGVDPAAVPSSAELLLGPLLRGSTVEVRSR